MGADAEADALDLSRAVKVVVAGGSLFAPDVITERWLFSGPLRVSGACEHSQHLLILAAPVLRTEYV